MTISPPCQPKIDDKVFVWNIKTHDFDEGVITKVDDERIFGTVDDGHFSYTIGSYRDNWKFA